WLVAAAGPGGGQLAENRGSLLATSDGPRQLAGRQRRLPGGACQLVRRGGLRHLGQQKATDGSGIRIRSTRGTQRRVISLGSRAYPQAAAAGQLLSGQVALAQSPARWLFRGRTHPGVSSEPLRPLRHGGKRSLLVSRLVCPRRL